MDIQAGILPKNPAVLGMPPSPPLPIYSVLLDNDDNAITDNSGNFLTDNGV